MQRCPKCDVFGYMFECWCCGDMDGLVVAWCTINSGPNRFTKSSYRDPLEEVDRLYDPDARSEPVTPEDWAEFMEELAPTP